MKKGHFYYAKWTLNSNCILTVISILKQEIIAPGFSEISAQNHFYFATRQFLPETKSQKFQNRHINVQNGHIKMKLTVIRKNVRIKSQRTVQLICWAVRTCRNPLFAT